MITGKGFVGTTTSDVVDGTTTVGVVGVTTTTDVVDGTTTVGVVGETTNVVVVDWTTGVVDGITTAGGVVGAATYGYGQYEGSSGQLLQLSEVQQQT
uniref:Uncharacterized protein n=1 Tax=Panagrolaimus sp. ES5 TaxID=591445 RepID=A0AC34FC62_9BILA